MPVNDCCKNPANLVQRELLEHEKPGPTAAGIVTKRVCQVCGRRHFHMAADPGRIGAVGSGLGKTA